ncbi:MAG: hypothetical protein KBC64_00780 [Simkaniaceae bacterium]|nr:hypothetical protein [Simkaniaceae bacterium]
MNAIMNKVGIPYDPNHPFELTLAPGETATLYGNITFTNNTNEAIHVKLRFDLQKGFQASINGKEEVSVSMHHSYPLNPSQEAAAQILLETLNRSSL